MINSKRFLKIIKGILDKKISKFLYIIIFTFHIPFILFLIYIFELIDPFVEYIFSFFSVILYIGVILPIVILFDNTINTFYHLPEISILNIENRYSLPWVVLFYFITALIITYFRKNKKISILYTILSIFLMWFILFILSVIFFHSQLGE